MRKKVWIILADGFEEIEAVTPIDVLRRAGLDVQIVGVGKREITGAHGMTLCTDLVLEQTSESPDAVILPGGMPGAENLSKSEALKKLLCRMDESRRVIGAICAAPALVLAPQGLLEGRRATCYPSFENRFGSRTEFSQDRVVTDGHVITSRGPGSAFEFALELVERLCGEKEAERLAEAMLVSKPVHRN